MILKALVENTGIDPQFGVEHGLSLYIETTGHKILFDTGAGGLFAENAKKMKVDLSQVDLAILSHGHYDHGGGLKTFFEINGKAAVYVRKEAFGRFYSQRPDGMKWIGLDESLQGNMRFRFVEGDDPIEEALRLFVASNRNKSVPSGNRQLFKEVNGTFVHDDFVHEQSLIIREGDKNVLFAGCAHSGILNILDRYRELEGRLPDVVVGGFHLYNRNTDLSEDPAVIEAIAQELLATGALFYTGHCTGVAVYESMKKIMGDRIAYLSTGMTVEI